MPSDIVERLKEANDGDHDRGCEGRMYTCSCGYDGRIYAAAADAAAEIERLRASLKWVGEVYPSRLSHGGAGVEITWGEFNAMRVAIGLKPATRIAGEEVRAGYNARLRAEIASLRSALAAVIRLRAFEDARDAQENEQ